MARRLRISDQVTFEPIETITDSRIKDNVGNGQHLLVRIAATHAGIITGNNTFYLPDRMKRGTSTWTAQYNKPVLKHHNSNDDAIGRVISASYVDLVDKMTGQIRNSICKDSYLISDSLKSFIDGKLSRNGEVQFICDVLSKNGVLDDKNYQGLGYCEIIASITDPEAIQKIRDGRYLTGSVSASTDGAACSICKSDWIEDGRCDHTPGEIYDGERAFLIAGDFEYEEYSYVNRPADIHSRNLELVTDGKVEEIAVRTESKEKKNKMLDNTETVKETIITEEAVVKEITQFSDSAAEDLESKFQEIDLSAADLSDELSDIIYELMLRELEGDKTLLSDAKLSAEKRKGLSKDTFCGPGRSFPVPDCAHVTAAKRLIGRYKGNKDGIMSCVNSKAKTLGCDGSDSKIESPEVTDTTKTTDCTPCAEVADKLKVLEKENSRLNDHLTALREEMKLLHRESADIQDELVQSKLLSRTYRARHILDLKKLSGTEIKDEAADFTMLTQLDDKQLNTQVESVDIKKIIDRLNSGLANNPEGTVSDPSVIADKQIAAPQTPEATRVAQQVQDTYEFIRVREGAAQANIYLDRMRREGNIK